MKYDYKEIGKRIKKCRKEYRDDEFISKAPTQEQFAADRLFIKRDTLSRYENGHAIPPIDTLLRMCELFNCELGYLLGEYDTKTRIAADIHAETGLSESSISVLREINSINYDFAATNECDDEEMRKRVFREAIRRYFVTPPLIPFIDKLIADGYEMMETIRQIISDEEFKKKMVADGSYIQYLSLYEQFKDEADARTVFQICVRDFDSTSDDADIERIYDILDGKNKRIQLFTIQDSFMDIVKDFVAERSDDHGKSEKK